MEEAEQQEDQDEEEEVLLLILITVSKFEGLRTRREGRETLASYIFIYIVIFINFNLNYHSFIILTCFI